MADNFLIKQEAYLEAGIHIGTKLKVVDMNPFIYRVRNDGLFVLDLRKIDERIRMAGKLLAKYEPGEVMVVASRTYSGNAAAVFSSVTGIKVFQGRFIPGILTNVSRPDFVEPKLLLICDPKSERQAVTEAGTMGIPIVGLCDSDNGTSFIDWVIPCNNKGRRSLALIFYLLAREFLMGRGKIASYDEFSTPLSLFEAEPGEETAAAPGAPSEAAPESVKAAVQEEKAEVDVEAEQPEAPEPSASQGPAKEGEEGHQKKHAHAHKNDGKKE
jgi:small subunit ribosomal protein S2